MCMLFLKLCSQCDFGQIFLMQNYNNVSEYIVGGNAQKNTSFQKLLLMTVAVNNDYEKAY